MNNIIFEILDKTGRKIRLTKERWSHINNHHPDMSDKIEEIKLALTKPTLITPHKYNDNMGNYYRYQKETHDYLLVIVKYLNNEGYVTSAFPTSKIMKK